MLDERADAVPGVDTLHVDPALERVESAKAEVQDASLTVSRWTDVDVMPEKKKRRRRLPTGMEPASARTTTVGRCCAIVRGESPRGHMMREQSGPP
jgi:hypothetical protein